MRATTRIISYLSRFYAWMPDIERKHNETKNYFILPNLSERNCS